jgi:hypothetical protein
MTRLRRLVAALAAFARGFVGAPAHAPGCTASAARAALRGAAERRGRCC